MFDELFEKILYETLTDDQRLEAVEKAYADWKHIGAHSTVMNLGQRAADLRLKVIEDEDKTWKGVDPGHKLNYAKARLQFWTELSNYDSNNKNQMDKWNGIVQELEGQPVAEVKETKIVGLAPDNETVEIDRNVLLDIFSRAAGDLKLGYSFSGEKEVDDKQVFEFLSSQAPKIELVVHGKIVK